MGSLSFLLFKKENYYFSEISDRESFFPLEGHSFVRLLIYFEFFPYKIRAFKIATEYSLQLVRRLNKWVVLSRL